MKRKRLLLFLGCTMIAFLIFAVRHIESGTNIVAYFSDPQIVTVSVEKHSYTSEAVEMIGNVTLSDMQQEKLKTHIADGFYIKTNRKYFPIASPIRYKIVAEDERGVQVLSILVIQSHNGTLLWVDYVPGNQPAVHMQHWISENDWSKLFEEFFSN